MSTTMPEPAPLTLASRIGLPSVAMVVLNWNGMADTLRCLASLADATYAPLTVVVVDNGSTDGSVDEIRARHPEVHLIEAGANLGYTGGNDLGLRWALDSGAELIGVLNNDTVVSPGFLQPLVAELEASPRSALSPLITFLDPPDRVWFDEAVIDEATGLTLHPSGGKVVDGRHETVETPALTGCCIVAAASVWREVGLFDDRYFLLFEDYDWSARAARAGVRMAVVGSSRIAHAVSASFPTGDVSLASYYYARNTLLFVRLHGTDRWRKAARVIFSGARGAVAADGASVVPWPARLGGVAVRVVGLAHFVLGRWGRAPGYVEKSVRRLNRYIAN